MSCIFSTLTFIINQAKELNNTTPVLTFHQPSWLKANEIKYATKMPFVLILEVFHTMMSYCGSIGALMEGPYMLQQPKMAEKDTAKILHHHQLA